MELNWKLPKILSRSSWKVATETSRLCLAIVGVLQDSDRHLLCAADTAGHEIRKIYEKSHLALAGTSAILMERRLLATCALSGIDSWIWRRRFMANTFEPCSMLKYSQASDEGFPCFCRSFASSVLVRGGVQPINDHAVSQVPFTWTL